MEGVAWLAEDPDTRYSALDPSGHPSHPGVEDVAWLAEDPSTRHSALDPSDHPKGVLPDWRRIHASLLDHSALYTFLPYSLSFFFIFFLIDLDWLIDFFLTIGPHFPRVPWAQAGLVPTTGFTEG